MFRNYCSIAFRHLQRHKFLTAINVFGLAVGMACCILIVLYVRDELSFDRFHHKADSIYRLTKVESNNANGTMNHDASTQIAVGPALKKEISGIKDVVRIFTPGTTLYTYGDKKILEAHSGYADASFFQMFDFPLLEGDPATVLKAPYTVVLSASAARRYFGTASPVGKLLKVGNKYNCTVTGVAADMPANTDLRMDVIQSFATLTSENNRWEDMWYMFTNNVTYVELAKDVTPTALMPLLKDFVELHIGEITRKYGIKFFLELQPLQHVHLHPDSDSGGPDNTPMIWLYVAIAAFIVLIACINFMNLTTARANERAKEVGLRKALGAERKSLVLQFLTESLVISVLSLIGALLLVLLFMPLFNNITGKELVLFASADVSVYGGLLLLVAIVGLLAGSYPALYLSGLIPVKVLKGSFITPGRKTFIRRALVVSQFAIAVVLIVASVVVYSQLRFWQEKNLGFDKDHLVNVYLDGIDAKAELLRTELKALPGVQQASVSNFLIGVGIMNGTAIAREGADSKESFIADVISGDDALLKTTAIKLVTGRDFDPAMSTDSTAAFIVNRAAAKRLGFTDPLGKRIEWRPGNLIKHGTIIGVVEDFNYRSLHYQIGPVVYQIRPQDAEVLTIRLAPGDNQKQLAGVERVWNKLAPDIPFNFSFVDQALQQQYAGERTMGKIFGLFASLAVFIACIGLLGLSMLIARQRTKEIGIRKVLGASVAHVSALLSRDFLKQVLAGIAIGLPIAWYGMEQWLSHFAFRVPLHWWLFVLTAVVVILIALFTVSIQSVKAALMNPIKSLRTE
ncbi:putative ABC transport system permease protein [Chitinophaga eiseniae]|uniref:Putative ABC transport system permease protein n=1 Tax=Chitinophaga eiseniae TaxID=634771 RepID=A0A1T4RRG0_9BACT|nr:ABC transporter permease [Chitinophaga eiseniae]SKA18605.1 putative ABC transport system permease protein [Chitinophaga eiseniae]